MEASTNALGGAVPTLRTPRLDRAAEHLDMLLHIPDTRLAHRRRDQRAHIRTGVSDRRVTVAPREGTGPGIWYCGKAQAALHFLVREVAPSGPPRMH